MLYTWFKIFNKVEFLATGLVSRTYSLNLETIGVKDILVTKGNRVGLTYEGVFLTLQDDPEDENWANPFVFDGYAIYINQASDVFLGIEINEN